jgi:hypothetical protein
MSNHFLYGFGTPNHEKTGFATFSPLPQNIQKVNFHTASPEWHHDCLTGGFHAPILFFQNIETVILESVMF